MIAELSRGIQRTKHTAYAIVCVILPLFCQSCFKDIPDKIVVYQSDFENDDTSHITVYGDAGRVDSIKTARFNGSKVLGFFNRNLVFFTIPDLRNHDALRIEFDLYIHDKWEGDKVAPGYALPDFWTLVLNGYTIHLATFSNGIEKQSFPDKYTGAPSINPPHANGWAVLPGICSYGDRSDGSTKYKIDYTTAHNGSVSMIIADLIQGPSSHCIKSWSIDNLRLTAITYKQ